MINFLKKLFNRNSTKEVRVSDLTHTPAATFELAALTNIQRGITKVWEQTSEIDDISEEIQYLMEQRQKRVQERLDLVTVINNQRKSLGLEEIDEEGIALSDQPAEDETYALEP